MSSVSDERGQELQYAGIPISKIFEDNMGIGGVLSLLWFQKRLPEYAGKFFEMCLMITGDHGPAVSGAHNTIVCARAGKDLVSSLTSGLLTIVSYNGTDMKYSRVRLPYGRRPHVECVPNDYREDASHFRSLTHIYRG